MIRVVKHRVDGRKWGIGCREPDLSWATMRGGTAIRRAPPPLVHGTFLTVRPRLRRRLPGESRGRLRFGRGP